MNKWNHINDMQKSYEELTSMQDRILDRYNPQNKDHNEILIKISQLKQEFEELIYLFETTIP